MIRWRTRCMLHKGVEEQFVEKTEIEEMERDKNEGAGGDECDDVGWRSEIIL